MKALIVKPRCRPCVADINPSLRSLQETVGGYIQAIYPYSDPVALICDEEGKLNGKQFNRALRDEDGRVYDAISGTFLVVGLTDEDFGPLSDELAEKYAAKFHDAEELVCIFGKTIIAPLCEGEYEEDCT